MPVGYPLAAVVGSKGGVGATTIAAGLLRSAPMQAVGVDLTHSHDLAATLQVRAISIASVVRRPRRMPALVEGVLARKGPILALDLEGRLYPQRVAEMLRLLRARRPVIVDGGRHPSETLLSLATHVLLVTVPDVRSVVRAEAFLERWRGCEVILVENKSGASPLMSGAIPIPQGEERFSRQMSGPVGEALRALADELLPGQREETEAETEGPQRGIIRSLVNHH